MVHADIPSILFLHPVLGTSRLSLLAASPRPLLFSYCVCIRYFLLKAALVLTLPRFFLQVSHFLAILAPLRYPTQWVLYPFELISSLLFLIFPVVSCLPFHAACTATSAFSHLSPFSASVCQNSALTAALIVRCEHSNYHLSCFHLN